MRSKTEGEKREEEEEEEEEFIQNRTHARCDSERDGRRSKRIRRCGGGGGVTTRRLSSALALLRSLVQSAAGRKYDSIHQQVDRITVRS